HRLTDEADFWWDNTRERMIAVGTLMTWNNFKNEFLAKYFPADAMTKKEIEFLKLEQGMGAEGSKCVKFEGGLRPEIKKAVGYQEIRNFAALVNKSRIYEEDSKASSRYYKASSEKRHAGQNRNKPYDKSREDQEGKQKTANGRETSGGGNSNSSRCFKCGEIGHHVAECQETKSKCFRCGRLGHMANECRSSTVTCFRCGEPGHTRPQCGKPK
ncbi:cellular nucleic acid-binding protein, partial [Trifolium pratense]